MLRKIKSWLISARTTKSIAITLGTLSLFVLIASLAACSFTQTPALTVDQKPALAQSSAQSALKVGGLVIRPANVNPGEVVTIVANVTNTGDNEEIYKAELVINNAKEASKTLIIPSGLTQTLNFIVSKDKPGTYDVVLGGIDGQFTVVDQVKLLQQNNIDSNTATDTTSSDVPNCCVPTSTTQDTPTLPKAGGGCCGR